MKRALLSILLLSTVLFAGAVERVNLWPKGKMPDPQDHQIAALRNESSEPDFKPEKHRAPYIEWLDAPEKPNGGCVILISGGGYNNLADVKHVTKIWPEKFSSLGFQCVRLFYRTPRPKGLPIYQSAWEDGQRAVRLVRSEAEKRGFDPDKIGVVGMSAGSHLCLLLAANSETRAYEPVDKKDEIPCNIAWAILHAPAYVTTDSEAGSRATREGYGADVRISSVFKFDSSTCPISMQHGGLDPYTPNGSTLIYRELRRRGIPAEVHLYPNFGHKALGLDRAVEFLHQMGFTGPLEPEEKLMDRYTSDSDREKVVKEPVWPEGKMPNPQENQCEPYIEWHFPKVMKTTAIQIIYSGGGYSHNDPDDFEVAPARRYLNAMGMTVVTLKYRIPRPLPESGLAKHTTAWQDLQRTIRLVRSEAASYGLDPDHIGIMGSSAGGHLTLMGVTSSRHNSYLPKDDIDKLPCNVQWGIGIYPAYSLTDNADFHALHGGNLDEDVLVPEFSFDLDTAPMLMIHGDADPWPSMNSVKVWEKMRAMGIQSELHTLALRPHCFQRSASPGTGSYTWLDRIGEYVKTMAKFDE